MLQKINKLIIKISSTNPESFKKARFNFIFLHFPKIIWELGWILMEKTIPIKGPVLDEYINWYKMFDFEINTLNIKKSDKILNIGCGAIPSTAILIYEKTKAKVVGVDKNKSSVKKALKILKNKDLLDKIEILYGDGKNIKVNNYNIIIITRGVMDVENVLKNISINAEKNVTIILRIIPGYKEKELNHILNKLNLQKIKIIKDFGPTCSVIIYKKDHD